MEKPKNVIKINGLGGSNGDRNMTGQQNNSALFFARLPSHFLIVKEKGSAALKPLLQALFDNIDDALFELADRAELNHVQNMYFESMREIRIKRRGMEEGFARELETNFRQLLVSAESPPLLSNSTEPASFEGLSLVEDEGLEELVAADSMIAKSNRQYSKEIRHLTLYMDVLITDNEVTSSNNPLGPRSICNAFIAVCRDLDLDIKAKLVLFKLFDRYVMGALDSVYKISSEALRDSANIKELQSIAPASETISRNLSEQGIDQQPVNSIFPDLQKLLHSVPSKNRLQVQTPGVEVKSGLLEPGQATQIPSEKLLQLLQVVQQTTVEQLERQQALTFKGHIPDQPDIKKLLGHLLADNLASSPMSMGQLDDDAINLVAMLFRFILDDCNLAAPMKGLISQLQIPIIKVAMLDKSFFSKSGHPARKLLNEIAHASMGWSGEGNIDRDPLYKKVLEIVNRLLESTDNSLEFFKEVLADFVAFVEIDSRRTHLVEQRTINAEDGKAKAEVARATVQALLEKAIDNKPLPEIVKTLLQDAWSNVLFLNCLKQEDEPELWQEAQQLAKDLVWSVQPMVDAGSRQRLIKIIPNMLKSLRLGLTQIGYNPFDMNKMFTDLEVLHLAQLRSSIETKILPPVAKIPQVKLVEKALDQLLEDHANNSSSLEQLDAELEAQLAEFDLVDEFQEREEHLTPANAGVENHASQSSGIEKEAGAAEKEDPLIPPGPSSQASEQQQIVSGSSDSSINTIAGQTDTADHENIDNVGNVENVEKATTDHSETDAGELEENDPILVKVDALAMGNWVEIHQQDGKKFRCRLAAVIRSTGKYIFVNRSGMKVAEHNRMSLAIEIKHGTISLLDDGLLFDRALESVIGNLRNSKANTS